MTILDPRSGKTATRPGNEPHASTDDTVQVHALLLGERLDTRALEQGSLLARTPLTLQLADDGIAVLFRYGAVVLFGASAAARDSFVTALAAAVSAPFAVPEREDARLRVRADSDVLVDAGGTICIRERTTESLQLVADILAKSLVLAHYEQGIAGLFDRIEPLAARLREKGRPGAGGRELLRQIGDVLLIQHNTVGRVETGEKPELLWEHPELERLYMRLAEEYELRDRDRALDRKLEVVSRTVETLLGLIQARSSLRVEWYILVLIVAELLLSLFSFLPRPWP